MNLLIGTGEGLYTLAGQGQPAAAEELAGRSVRRILRVNGTVFAGADDGVYRSEDGGRQWQKAGVDGKTIWDIVPAPRSEQTLYAGTQPAHVFRSDDGGRTWSEIDGLRQVPGYETWCVPNSPLGARARTIVLDPADPQRFWVGVEVGGILTTTDGGRSFSLACPGQNPDIHVMTSHPAQPNVLYATTGYGRIDNSEPMEKRIAGLFRSKDAGQTWEWAWGDLQPRYTRPICFDPRSPHALSVACAPSAFSSYKDEGGAKSMLYRSDDGGDTWRSLGDADHSPSAANILAVSAGRDAGHVLVGTDTGEVWDVSPRAEWTLLTSGLPIVQAVEIID